MYLSDKMELYSIQRKKKTEVNKQVEGTSSRSLTFGPNIQIGEFYIFCRFYKNNKSKAAEMKKGGNSHYLVGTPGRMPVAFGSALGDLDCFIPLQQTRLTQLLTVNIIDEIPNIFDKLLPFQGTVDWCAPAVAYFTQTGVDAAVCGLKKITVQKALDFTKEICDDKSKLNGKFKNSKKCLLERWDRASECKDIFSEVINAQYIAELKENFKKSCKNIEAKYKCLKERVGRYCEKEGYEVANSTVEALSSYTKGLCLEINGTTFIRFQWHIVLGLLTILMMWYNKN